MFLKKNLWMIFVIGVIGLCLANSISLVFYSLPWYDEVFFADITHSLVVNNTLTLNMLLSPVEASVYGPVYFYTQKVIIYFLGFGMWQFRLLNLASGIALLIIFLTIAKKLNISKLNICILIALIAFDSRFLFNMSGGRMDLFALALFMGGWLLFRNTAKRTYMVIVIAGLLSSLSFLTTPRIGFYFLVYILIFILEFTKSNNRNKIFIQFLVFGFAVLAPVLIWIFYSFGNLTSYVNYVFNNPAIANHFGSSIFPVKYQIPLIILWFLSGVFVFRSKGNILNPLLVALFSLPFFHLVFIKEVGPYSAMMMPFIYSGIVIGVNSMPVKKLSVIPGIIAVYMFLFSLSSAFNNIASVEFTNPDSFNTFFRSQGIINTNVLADFPYYYFVTENDNRFISFFNNKTELTANNLNKYNIGFAVITKENFNNNSDFFKELGFNTIEDFSTKKDESFFYKIALSLGKNIRIGYDGFVLKRVISEINCTTENQYSYYHHRQTQKAKYVVIENRSLDLNP